MDTDTDICIPKDGDMDTDIDLFKSLMNTDMIWGLTSLKRSSGYAIRNQNIEKSAGYRLHPFPLSDKKDIRPNSDSTYYLPFYQ